MRQFLWAFMVLLLSALLYLNLDSNSIKTNLFALLPEESHQDIPQHAVDVYSEKLSRKVIFLFSAKSDQQAIALAEINIPKLEKSELFSELKIRISKRELTAYYESFESYRFSLLSDQDRAGLKRSSSKWLSQKLTNLFVSPISGLDSNTLLNDPFLLYQDYLAGLPRGNPKAQLVSGYTLFHDNNESHLFVYAELSNGAFIQSVQDKFSELMASLANGLSIEHHITVFGVIRYALENRVLAEKEVSTIGIGSLMGIIIIFFFVFRRLLLLPAILLPVLVGGLAAFSISLLIFGELHLISLVFGASLIGVSIDYALHYCCSHSNLSNSTNNMQALARVRSALMLGLITSSIGYLTLSLADFPALQQMASIAISGLAGAYFTVIFWLPTLIKKPLTVQPGVALLVAKWTSWLEGRKAISVWLVVLFAIVLYGLNLVTKNNQDDVKILRAHLPELESTDRHVQQVLGEFPNNQFFIVAGGSQQEVMNNERILIDKLRKTSAGTGRVYALSEWFPDLQQQKDNYKLIKSSLIKNKAFSEDLLAAGIAEDILTSYKHQVSNYKFKPMNLEDFLQSPLGKLHNNLWLGEINERLYSIVSLYGFKDLDILREIETHADVVLVDRSQSISNLLAKYRTIIEYMFPFILLTIFILLSFRFGFQDSFRVVSAPLLAAMLSFLWQNIFVGSYNLFSIFGLIITIAISIDYAIFIRESKGYSKATYLAISLASLTTMLALGLLSLSNTPALSAFGLSLLLGVLFSLLITPVIVRPKI